MEGLAPLREASGLTQGAFAAKLGVSRNRLCMWENQKAWPPSWILPKIAEILGVAIEQLYVTPGGAETP